jgi:cytoskeletal protein CcmA (bactofilin family)
MDMKKFYQILLGVTLLIIGSTGLSQAQETKMMAANTAAVEKVANPNFKFAENLVISEDLNGDVYAAGGTVRIDGNINGDLIVAGGQVYINGNISQDLRVFGGTVTINGIVEQNASIFAGEVELGPNSEINGSVVGGAGNGNFSGSIMGGTWFGAGNTSLAGKHGDQVNLWTESAQLLSNSEINGDLNIEMDKAGEIDDQNPQISGQKNIKVAETSKQINQQKGQFSKITKGANGAGQVIKFLMSLSFPKD